MSVLARPTTAAGMVAAVALVDGTFYDIARPAIGYSPPPEVLGHALARINRWMGQTTRPVSVARHSLIVASAVGCVDGSPRRALAALLHDAAEALIGDVPAPAKRLLGPAWTAIERPIQAAIATDYGISIHDIEHEIVVAADRWALVHEAAALMPFNPAELGFPDVDPTVNRPGLIAGGERLGIPASITRDELEDPQIVARIWIRAVHIAQQRLTTETP